MQFRGFVLGGGAYDRQGERCFALSIVNLDARSQAPELVATPFLPHGLAVDPHDPCRVVVFEKKGPGAALLDLYRPRSLTRTIETLETRHFYGHGVFSADGALLYATESQLDDALAGRVVVRDGRSFDELGSLPTGGAAPHDCALIDEGRTLVVTNGGGPFGAPHGEASVAYIDVDTGKIRDRLAIPDPRFNAGHLATNSVGDLAVVSAPRDGLRPEYPPLGAVTLRPRGGQARTMTGPPEVVARMLGETLSVLLDDAHDLVLATHPLGNMVTVWRLSSGTWLETIDVQNPRGVAMSLDGGAYIVSHSAGPSVRLSAYARPTREHLGVVIDPSFMSGSHLYVLAL